MVMGIHTFGDYPEKYHPHLHAIVTDGLFTERGTSYVMPKVDSKPLEEIFRARVFTMLKEEEKITEELIDKLMNWNHSGFSVHKGEQIARDDEEGREKLAQYIIRNTFSMDKLTYNEDTNTVIYHSKMSHGNNKKNFEVYSAEEFITPNIFRISPFK